MDLKVRCVLGVPAGGVVRWLRHPPVIISFRAAACRQRRLQATCSCMAQHSCAPTLGPAPSLQHRPLPRAPPASAAPTWPTWSTWRRSRRHEMATGGGRPSCRLERGSGDKVDGLSVPAGKSYLAGQPHFSVRVFDSALAPLPGTALWTWLTWSTPRIASSWARSASRVGGVDRGQGAQPQAGQCRHPAGWLCCAGLPCMAVCFLPQLPAPTALVATVGKRRCDCMVLLLTIPTALPTHPLCRSGDQREEPQADCVPRGRACAGGALHRRSTSRAQGHRGAARCVLGWLGCPRAVWFDTMVPDLVLVAYGEQAGCFSGTRTLLPPA